MYKVVEIIFIHAYYSMFFGIIIRMYYVPKEHTPPHIHAYYNNYTASFNINNTEIINGNLPPKQIKLIMAWIEIHKEELMANWELCQAGDRQVRPAFDSVAWSNEADIDPEILYNQSTKII